MIQFDEVTFQYPGRGLLFDRFNWQAARGEIWTVLGQSGCGKTSLLYLLAGLMSPQAGQVRVDGQVAARPRPQTGLVLQDLGLLPWETVQQNAALGQRVRGFYGPDGRHAPADAGPQTNPATWLERLGLKGLEKAYPQQLSGGQRQRVAIARTLLLQPDMLLMDEPFSALDAATRDDLLALMLELQREQNLTMVVVTHLIEDAIRLGGHVLVMRQPPHREAVMVHNPAPDDAARLRQMLGEGTGG